MAQRAGVGKFIYVSVFRGPSLLHLDIVKAHEDFVSELRGSGLSHAVIRPTGFFSDMGEYMKMAKRGRVYLFGDGNNRINPIHGADLARFCSEEIQSRNLELDVGGPETLSHKQMAQQAYEALGKVGKMSYIPTWVTRLSLFLMRIFTSSKTYGPIEFFMNVMSMDMVAPAYGERSLEEHYRSLALDSETR